jgi:4-hydroxythreonine-4-phosphate dehydrogenase
MSNLQKTSVQSKPLLGISVGDINGVSPEIIIKALSDQRIVRYFTPIIYASSKIFNFYKKSLDINFSYQIIRDHKEINERKVNIINVWDDSFEITPGKPEPETGKYALISLQRAVEDLKNGLIDGLVTCPINKDFMQSEEFKFPGHTEYLGKAFESDDYLMLMVANQIRIGVATGHIPLKDVAAALTEADLKKKIKALLKSLKQDFGIQKPRVAVLGLNPHAGENGLLGSEEKDLIKPVIDEFKNGGNLVFGPFPADGFFGTMAFKKYDGVLAMYHDQGLTPFKYMAFENGVNFTAGLPIVRTSPDHGTAYDIAGKNLASENSFREALYLAAEIVNQRKSNLESR